MRRYRIFISSTIDDLLEARTEAERCLRTLEVFDPIRVEGFPASGEPSETLCLEEIRKADAVLLLLGSRYGYVPSQDGNNSLSVTHLEYRGAKKFGIPVFAFIRKDEAREPSQQKFIEEVQEFSSGVFRKLWSSIDILSKEVTRSFIWWLARLARRHESTTASRETASEKLKSQKLDRVRVTVEDTFQDGVALSGWVKSVIEESRNVSAIDFLPQPFKDASGDEDLPSFTIRLNRITASPLVGIDLLISREQLTKGSLLQTEETHLVRFAYLELEATSNTIKVASIAIKCLMTLLAEDPDRCVKDLVQLVRNTSLNEPSRIAILQTAAGLNLSHRLGHDCLIAEEVLNLSDPSYPLINLAVHNLVMSSATLRVRGLGVGYKQVSKLLCLLFERGLALGVSGAEALYSLARQLLNLNPSMALPVYQLLLKAHPFYDERWYFHRDLGLLFYGEGTLTRAATHYDQASRLKNDDSELFRFAGDAYFYSGRWMEALSRYEKALAIEQVEKYFLDGKMEFCRIKLRQRLQHERLWTLRRALSSRLSRTGVFLAEWNFKTLPRIFFRITQRLHATDYSAAKWMALFANERGDYVSAIQFLTICLCSLPESYSDRLNLTLNLIFQAGGKWTEPAIEHAKAAIFFAGPSAKERFILCLLNTATKDELVRFMENALIPQVTEEREAWRQRRREILKPQKYGGVLHIEFRD